jgi:copper chaperone CopZ
MRTLSLLIALFAVTFSVFAQQETKKKTETIEIRTSAVCGMCKDKIETALNGTKGVKYATLNMTTKAVTVKYRPEEVTPDQLRAAITATGYDADDVPADPKAYEKLHACCKKGGH